MIKTCPMCKYAMTPIYRYVGKSGKLIRKIYRWICTHCSYQCNA